MNKKFLYKKPWIPGVIDDTNSAMDWLEEDDSKFALRKKFNEGLLDELVLDLVDIFQNGDPAYNVLMPYLSSNNELNEEKMMYTGDKNERISKDISSVEMLLDAKNFMIRHLKIYVQDISPFHGLESKLNELYPDIPYQERKDGFMIPIRGSIITVMKHV
ncbi:hypothetical protein [Thermoactinomyces sp. DSM 45892]|uniref:hypothetical protein n=1 Tax=Thermoactinomyces sp. DSM 45892 TaxID=1882753 RepID=UPI0008948708|nr:hypothetical protein [Thermoactinomyces sp. DSM 45892]SDZ37608.1 hypothetical protein SAMN05444416_1292 [Thermoactinomyces sp. DSM 45892]